MIIAVLQRSPSEKVEKSDETVRSLADHRYLARLRRIGNSELVNGLEIRGFVTQDWKSCAAGIIIIACFSLFNIVFCMNFT